MNLISFMPNVIVKGTTVYIENMPIKTFIKDIAQKEWSPKLLKLYKLIYHWYDYTATRGTLAFDQFFCLETAYILTQLPQRQAYQKALELLYTKTWLSSINMNYPSRVDLSQLSKITYTLKDYQLDFLKVYDQKKQQYRLNGYLNAFQPGMGKTVTSIALMECLHKDIIIVVAPNNTLYATWVAEIQNTHKEEQTIWTPKTPTPNAKWYIINYESMNKIVDMLKSGEIKIRGKKVGYVIDEIHNFRYIKTLRSQHAIEIAELTKTEDILPMSGTPIKALSVELIPLMALLDPNFNTKVMDIFKKAFGSQLSLMEIVANRLGSMMYRFAVNPNLKTLPEKHEETIKVKLPNGNIYTLPYLEKVLTKYTEERRKYYSTNKAMYLRDYNEGLEYFEKHAKYNKEEYANYKKIVKRIINNTHTSTEERATFVEEANKYEKTVIMPVLPSELRKRFKKAKSVVKYVNLVIMGECIGNILPKYRANLFSDIIKLELIPSLISTAIKKTIIFTTYGKVVEDAYATLTKVGYKPLPVHQKTAKLRDTYLKQFKTDKEANPLITTIQMMSTGVTLNEANTVIFAPTPFRYVDYEQASDRCHRIGQDTDVYVYTLVLDTDGVPNLSTRIENISDWSKYLFESIVGGTVDKGALADEAEDAGEESFFYKDTIRGLLSSYDVL